MRVSTIEIRLEKGKGISWTNWKKEAVVPEWVKISRRTLCSMCRETGDECMGNASGSAIQLHMHGNLSKAGKAAPELSPMTGSALVV